MTRIVALALLFGMPLAAADAEVDLYMKSLPAAEIPAFTQEQALALVSLPLSCVDRPQAVPEDRVEYLWVHDAKPHLLEAYDKNRAFYGCFDWHSAVHGHWCLVRLLRRFRCQRLPPERLPPPICQGSGFEDWSRRQIRTEPCRLLPRYSASHSYCSQRGFRK